MWIAFKNYYLRDEGQQTRELDALTAGCELLSKIIIFVMKDNNIFLFQNPFIVVNCFQKLLSSWWRTTDSVKVLGRPWLWIAFKNYYLRDEGQPLQEMQRLGKSCELLSKIIIFVMKDNIILVRLLLTLVVNCFQKLLSSWWRTTKFGNCTINWRLWIAFKNYYLRDEGQLVKFWIIGCVSCELLSKIIIFVMKDNINMLWQSLTVVVNCFQKLLSSWWRTTFLGDFTQYLELWIAFKNYYLRDEGQQAKDKRAMLRSCELLSKIIIFVMKDNFLFLIFVFL